MFTVSEIEKKYFIVIFKNCVYLNLTWRSLNHNSVWKTELDDFWRKVARRVEAKDGQKPKYS
jgi:hypothetical protein